MLRILVGGYALLYVVTRFFALTSVAGLAARQFDPAGPVAVLGAPLPYALVVAITLLAVPFGAAFVAGYRYRIAGPAFAALFLWATSYRNSWGMLFHTENLLVLHVAVLGLAGGAADAWSLDAKSRGRAEPPPDGRYGWPIALACLLTVTTYVLAGYAKVSVSGLSWVTSDTLRGLVAYDNLRKVELGAAHAHLGTALVGHGWLFPPLAAGSMAIEMGAPLALLGPRIGKIWCALAWSFHAGVVALMLIVFHYPLLGVGFASFFEVEKLGEWAIRWRARRLSAEPRVTAPD
jgi:hypothetical protein